MPAKEVIALVVDLIGSTENALKMSDPMFRRYSRAVIYQVWPYLKELDLDDSVVKFTGDGWLIFQPNMDKLRAMVALAKILASRFQIDISEQLDMNVEDVPDLRLAIASAVDEEIKLPNDSVEWVGDSARIATRASGCCDANELVVSESIRGRLRRDFHFTAINIEELPVERQPKKWEEDIPIFVVGELRESLIDDAKYADDPSVYAAYATYLQHTDRTDDAEELVDVASAAIARNVREVTDGRLLSEPKFAESQLAKTVGNRYERVLNVARRGDQKNSIIEQMRAVGATLKASQYNQLIHKSPSYSESVGWFDQMREDGVQPDVVTYSTLIKLSPDLATAEGWFDQMREDGVQPNVVTATSIASKVASLDEADALTKLMLDTKTFIGAGYYSSLYEKITRIITAEKLLEWHFEQVYIYNVSLETAVSRYERLGKVTDSLRIALAFPYFESSRRVFRKHYETSAAYYTGLIQSDFEPHNAFYALGICHYESSQDELATLAFRKALSLSTVKRRSESIADYLEWIADRSKPRS